MQKNPKIRMACAIEPHKPFLCTIPPVAIHSTQVRTEKRISGKSPAIQEAVPRECFRCGDCCRSLIRLTGEDERERIKRAALGRAASLEGAGVRMDHLLKYIDSNGIPKWREMKGAKPPSGVSDKHCVFLVPEDHRPPSP